MTCYGDDIDPPALLLNQRGEALGSYIQGADHG